MNNSDHEFLSAIKHAFDERIPFNRVLGMRITSIEEGRPTIRFEMRDELVGNYLRGNLHGGVISGVMDATSRSRSARNNSANWERSIYASTICARDWASGSKRPDTS